MAVLLYGYGIIDFLPVFTVEYTRDRNSAKITGAINSTRGDRDMYNIEENIVVLY